MTFKEYSNSQSHLSLATIRANWGRIQKAMQSDYSARFGEGKLGIYKTAGKVNSDGYLKIAHVKVVAATSAEIRAQRAKDNDSAARHDSLLAELETQAIDEGRKGLDLFALASSTPVTTPVKDLVELATA